MKKLLYGFLITTFLFLLAGCVDGSDFEYTDTSHNVGYHQCYLADTEVVLQPIVKTGFERESYKKPDSEDAIIEVHDYMLDELSYSVHKVDNSESIEVIRNTMTNEYTDDNFTSQDLDTRLMTEYIELVNTNPDFFDIGVLDVGEYEFELTSLTSYINQEDERTEDERTTTYTFTVAESCGDITTESIVLDEALTKDDFLSQIDGTNKEGNPLSSDDIVLYDDMIGSNFEATTTLQDGFISYIYGGYHYTEDDGYNDGDCDGETKCYYYYGDDEIYQDFPDNNVTELVAYSDTYRDNFFDPSYIEGVTIDYVNEQYSLFLEQDTYSGDYWYNVPVNVRGTNVYKTISIYFEEDTVAPTFDNIPDNQTITEGDSLDLLNLGLTATDNFDGDVTDFITSDTSDTSTLLPGDHTVTYTVEDNYGNTASVTILLTIYPLDTEAPTITTNNSLNTTFNVGDTLPDFKTYFTVIDDIDGSIPVTDAMLSWDNDIDMSVPGTYTLTLSTEDNALNQATDSITFTVIDSPPVFSNIPNDLDIEAGASVNLLDLGLTAMDAVDGDLTDSITVNIPDTSVLEEGNYVVTYTVIDSALNEVTTTTNLSVTTPTTTSELILEAYAFDEYTIDILFDIDAFDNSSADETAFTVTIDGVESLVSVAFVDGNMISLLISDPMSDTSYIEVSYQPTSSNDLTYDGNSVAAFENEYVEPPTGSGTEEYTGSVLFATAFDANTIDITFDVDTFDLGIVDQGAFTVTIDGVEATITNSFVNIDTVSLTISETMMMTSTIEVSYQPTGNSDLSYGGTLVPAFTNEQVEPPLGY